MATSVMGAFNMARNAKIDLSKYNEQGLRMLKVMCWAMNWYPRTGAPDLQKMLSEHTDSYTELGGTPEEWNNAAGFVYSHWGSGCNITPYAADYDFSELVSEQAGAGYDEGFDFSVYDADGRQRELVTRIEASLGGFHAYGNDTGFDEWEAGAGERLKKAAAKAAKAKARKDKRAADKEAVIASLTPKQRKALGL